MDTHRKSLRWLFFGDFLAIFVVTMIGFFTHYGAIKDWRWLTTFIPVIIGWAAVAPWLGVYRADVTGSWRQVWRSVLAAFLSAPLAAWLRGALLNSAILPVFVLVMALTDGLGFLFWRLGWTWIENKVFRHG